LSNTTQTSAATVGVASGVSFFFLPTGEYTIDLGGAPTIPKTGRWIDTAVDISAIASAYQVQRITVLGGGIPNTNRTLPATLGTAVSVDYASPGPFNPLYVHIQIVLTRSPSHPGGADPTDNAIFTYELDIAPSSDPP
jgi:hypothetical protein